MGYVASGRSGFPGTHAGGFNVSGITGGSLSLAQSQLIGNVGTAQAGIVIPWVHNPDATNLSGNPTQLVPVGRVGSPSSVARVVPWGPDGSQGDSGAEERDGNTAGTAGGGAGYDSTIAKVMDPDQQAYVWSAKMVVGAAGANYFADPTLHPAGGDVDNWVGPGNPNHITLANVPGFILGSSIIGISREMKVVTNAGTRADTNTLPMSWLRSALQGQTSVPAASGSTTDRGSGGTAAQHDWSDSYDEATCGSFANPPEGTTSSTSFVRVYSSVIPISPGSGGGTVYVQTHTAQYIKPDSAPGAQLNSKGAVRKEKIAVFPSGTSSATVLAGLAYSDTTTTTGSTLILVTAKTYNVADTLSTDPASNGWTLIGSQVDNTSGVSMRMWRITNAAARTHAEAIKWNNIRHQAACLIEIGGTTAGIALDQTNTSTGNASVMTTGSITPTSGAQFAVGAVAALNLSTAVPTHSAPTGWVYIDDTGSTTQAVGAYKGVSVDTTANNANRIRLTVGYRLSPPNSATNFQATAGVSRQYAGMIASFK